MFLSFHLAYKRAAAPHHQGEAPAARRIPGDHRRLAIPVPIPNTVVKQPSPMIVLLCESRLLPGFSCAPEPARGRFFLSNPFWLLRQDRLVGPSAFAAGLKGSWLTLAGNRYQANGRPVSGEALVAFPIRRPLSQGLRTGIAQAEPKKRSPQKKGGQLGWPPDAARAATRLSSSGCYALQAPGPSI